MSTLRASAVLVGAVSLGLALVIPPTATDASATKSAATLTAATPSASGAQSVPRKSHLIGETRPGTGVAEVTVSKHRVVEVDISYRFWRCSGPGSSRQQMGWSLSIFGPGNPRLRVGRDGGFAYRHASDGRRTFSRVALTGRFSANGRRVAGTFRWHQRGITRRGAVECRSPLIRYTAWVSAREFAGSTSQGVPWRGQLTWAFDLYRWVTGQPPPYIQGILAPTVGLSPPPPPFAELVLTCSPGQDDVVFIAAKVDPRTGQLSPTATSEPGEQLVLTGRASPLAEAGPASVSLSITYRSYSDDGTCSGSATFQSTELVPLVP